MRFRIGPHHVFGTIAVVAALLAFNLFVGNIHIAAPFGQLFVLRNSNVLSKLPLRCVPPATMPAGDQCYLVRERIITNHRGLQYWFIVSDEQGNTLNVFPPDNRLWLHTGLGSTLYAEPIARDRVRLTNPNTADAAVLADIDTNFRGRYNVWGLVLSGIALSAALLTIVAIKSARRRAAEDSIEGV